MDYREEFNNTIGNKYYATNIQVWSLNYILSYIEFLENQLQEKDKVIEELKKDVIKRKCSKCGSSDSIIYELYCERCETYFE